jgi:hypothetical protein
MKPGAGRVVFGVGLLAGAGCSAVLGIDADRYLAAPRETADAGTDGSSDAAPDGSSDAAPTGLDDARNDAALIDPWACLSQPPEVLDPDLQVTVTVQVMNAVDYSVAAGSVYGGSDLDTISGSWLPGVSIRPCDLLDPDCTTAPKAVVTNDAGMAVFELTGAFEGFFDLRRSDLVPATLYPGNLLAGQTTATVPAYGIRPGALEAIAQNADVSLELDAGVGHAFVTIYDCQDHQAAGVVLAYENQGASAIPFYFDNGLPNPAATETDGYGLGGAINVQVGTLTVTATLATSGARVGTRSFDVRPGALTFAWIRVRSH